jgi:hypothetical protein
MEAETVPQPTRPRLNPYTKALRRERNFSRRRLGWPYAEIAREEGLSQQRVQPDRRRGPGAARGRPAGGPRAASASPPREGPCCGGRGGRGRRPPGDNPYLNVLERIDRYQNGRAAKDVDDHQAGERLLAKMNRIVARLEAADARKAAKRAVATQPGASR